MPTTIHQINCGDAGAVAPYTADQFGTGGLIATYASTPILTGLTNPAPLLAYKDVRYNTHAYTFPNLTSGNYRVRLHFFDGFEVTANTRRFNVLINGVSKLVNYDIVGLNLAEAKDPKQARIEEFSGIVQNAGNQIVINFNDVTNSSLISAIEIIDTSVADTTAPIISSVVATAVNGTSVNVVVTDSDDTLVTGRDIEVSLTGALPQSATGAGGWTNLFSNVKQASYPHVSNPLTTYFYRARSRDAAAVPNQTIWSISNSVTTPDILRPFRADVMFPATAQGQVLYDNNTFGFGAFVGDARVDASKALGNNIGEKVNNAQAALLASDGGGTVYVPLKVNPTATTPILVKSNITVEFGRGALNFDITAADDNNQLPMPIEYESNTEIVGQGRFLTKISHNKSSLCIIKYSREGLLGDAGLRKVTRRNTMRDFTLIENPTLQQFDSTASAIVTGNTHDQRFYRIGLDRTHCLGITIGGKGDPADGRATAQNVLVEDCDFVANASQMLNVVNGENVTFDNNQFSYGGYPDYPPQIVTNNSFDLTTNILTLVANTAPITGWQVKLLRMAGSVQPAPLLDDQILYIIRVDASNVKLATSRENANAGIAIDLTTKNGLGTAQFNFFSITVPNGTFIDVESNNVDNKLINFLGQGNTFDRRYRYLRLVSGLLVKEEDYTPTMGAIVGYPAEAHAASFGNPGGHCYNIQFIGNTILGGIHDDLRVGLNVGSPRSNATSAVFMADIDDFLLSQNTVIRTAQAAFQFTNCKRGQVKNNSLRFTGGGGNSAMYVLRSKNLEVAGNTYTGSAQGGLAQPESNQILEVTDAAAAGLQNANNHYDNRGFSTVLTGATCTKVDRVW